MARDWAVASLSSALGKPCLEVLSYGIPSMAERAELFSLHAADLGGIGKAPVQTMSGGRKDRAVLTGVIAHGNHIVPGDVDKPVQAF